MVNPIRIQQVKQQEVRFAPPDHKASGFGPDLVMLRAAQRLECCVCFIGENTLSQ